MLLLLLLLADCVEIILRYVEYYCVILIGTNQFRKKIGSGTRRRERERDLALCFSTTYLFYYRRLIVFYDFDTKRIDSIILSFQPLSCFMLWLVLRHFFFH
ncbi:hypothetical protein CD36_07410 [Candida dubliniensis CD36]|uniref:Uncharacterized protein n=1 Tax=Candida dubliniensis (strain CD36 / ATCC MYA-646 / CBS 7987 / NCPF 3949 / NRRL Y-17841) TaxID=573826 RepID=B9W8H1_CANDC|nr:hypothetical protein CD36_07410 [Candida dubliniensis CD36]CAX45042.1 hypothetical protein CD36_07410 [Candida dubliniensis CD36]